MKWIVCYKRKSMPTFKSVRGNHLMGVSTYDSTSVLFEDEDPDLSDSEYLQRVMPPQSPDEGEFNNGEGKEENDDDVFAAAIEQALQQGSDDDDEEDEDGDESGEEGVDGEEDGDEDGASDSGSGSGSASGSDDDEDDEEYSGAKKLLDDEIKQLEVAIAKKNEDIAKVTNVALKVCSSLRQCWTVLTPLFP
jgi:transcription initiation factor TFIID subunit 7